MKWIKSTERLPQQAGFYTCHGTKEERLYFSLKNAKWWEDGTQRAEHKAVFWLDESAPSITADDVKDLEFKKSAGTPILYAEYHFAVTAFGQFAVGKRRGGTWEIIYPMQITPTPCADLEGGIELLNQHHKQYILSQLK